MITAIDPARRNRCPRGEHSDSDSLQAILQAADGLVPSRLADAELRRGLGQLALLKRAFAGFDAAPQQGVRTAPPSQWGHLRIVGRLGSGGFGEVLRAYDPVLQREVALKLRRNDRVYSGSDGDYIEEARRLARVRHPHVLAVYGADVADGRVGVWTDLICGETLEQRLSNDGPLPRDAVLNLATELASALAAIHRAGLVHGDIKPDNVMLDEGRAVLMDFGAGTVAGSHPRFGSPQTMAPELLEGQRASDRSDIYSLGALLVRAAVGDFDRDACKSVALQRQLRSALGRPLANRVGELLAAAPGLRPTALELLDQLDAIRRLPRQRARRIAVAAVVLALAAALAASLIGLQRVRAERDRSERIKDFVIQALQQASPSRARGPASIIEVADFMAANADERLAGLDDARAEIRLVAGSTLVALGEHGRGLALLEQGVGEMRTAPRSSQRDLAHALVNLSIARRDSGDMAGAIAAASEASVLFPQLPPEHENRLGAIRLSGIIGNLHKGQGRPLSALQAHRGTLAMRQDLLGNDDPRLAVDFNNIGSAALTAGYGEVAAQAYRDAERLLEKGGRGKSMPMVLVQWGLARSMLESGRPDEAERHLEQALSLTEQNFSRGDARLWKIRTIHPQVLLARGEPGLAVRAYSELFADSPLAPGESPMTLLGYGVALLQVGRAAEAEQRFRNILEAGGDAVADVAARQTARAGALVARATLEGRVADPDELRDCLAKFDASEYAARAERELLLRWIEQGQRAAQAAPAGNGIPASGH